MNLQIFQTLQSDPRTNPLANNGQARITTLDDDNARTAPSRDPHGVPRGNAERGRVARAHPQGAIHILFPPRRISDDGVRGEGATLPR